MRAAALAVLTALVLTAQPALAQNKTKSSSGSAAVLGALEMCETFALGDVLAMETAVGAGWESYDQTAESPFIKSYSASRDLRGLGWADLFSLVETYPDRILGYCRIDVAEPVGDGAAAIAAIENAGLYSGEVRSGEAGTYASLSSSGDTDRLLLTHWDDISFVIQLTILTPRGGASAN